MVNIRIEKEWTLKDELGRILKNMEMYKDNDIEIYSFYQGQYKGTIMGLFYAGHIKEAEKNELLKAIK